MFTGDGTHGVAQGMSGGVAEAKNTGGRRERDDLPVRVWFRTQVDHRSSAGVLGCLCSGVDGTCTGSEARSEETGLGRHGQPGGAGPGPAIAQRRWPGTVEASRGVGPGVSARVLVGPVKRRMIVACDESHPGSR